MGENITLDEKSLHLLRGRQEFKMKNNAIKLNLIYSILCTQWEGRENSHILTYWQYVLS